jgi:hypothetical protein
VDVAACDDAVVEEDAVRLLWWAVVEGGGDDDDNDDELDRPNANRVADPSDVETTARRLGGMTPLADGGAKANADVDRTRANAAG